MMSQRFPKTVISYVFKKAEASVLSFLRRRFNRNLNRRADDLVTFVESRRKRGMKEAAD
jgi:hypothetical protein